ncbi:DUF2834 domain-containing protein [Amnibacterium flavum]|uniref:DUF2834 domain-containing protein n=1 Tax=Amnibacterium flavum TaxID=2173173 RepID=A0A2V1HQZ9_9MICO|nr:DUF2834 domain-containing protein [Amnibacterium flavum]PVZ94072.1 hypothetical protein DDQ50_09980 [Amnibacterium flavum]
MTKNWTPLAVIYLVLALIGFAGTWYYNIRTVLDGRDFLGEILSAGPAVGSFSVDLLVVAIAAGAFMVIEGRRIGMRLPWVYLILAAVVALAFALPLFLSQRERRLDRSALRSSYT